jgi:hypothetical protein
VYRAALHFFSNLTGSGVRIGLGKDERHASHEPVVPLAARLGLDPNKGRCRVAIRLLRGEVF